MSEHRVIGYVANCGKNKFFAHGEAMLVTGTPEILKACIISRFRSKEALARYELRKVRYVDIEKSLDTGTCFSLDETAYNRFAEIALEQGRKTEYPFPERLKKNASGLPVIILRPRPKK